MSILRVVRFMRRRRACPAFSSRLVRAFAFSTARQAGQSSWSGFSSGLPQFLQVSIALPRVFLIFSRRRAAGRLQLGVGHGNFAGRAGIVVRKLDIGLERLAACVFHDVRQQVGGDVLPAHALGVGAGQWPFR